MEIEKDGEKIEVFTQEDLEAKTKEAEGKAIEKFKEDNPDRSEEITVFETKQKELEGKLEEALEAAGSEDPNKKAQIERLKGEIAVAKKEKQDALDKSDDWKVGLEAYKDEVRGDFVKGAIKKLAKDDEDVAKRIQFEFDNYRAHATTQEDIIDRIEKAHTLATGNPPTPGTFDGGVGAGVRGSGDAPKDKDAVGDNERAVGSALMVTDADREAAIKYKEEQAKKKVS